GASVHRRRRSGDRKHRLHPFQLARNSGRCERGTDGGLCHLRHRRLGRVRDDRLGHQPPAAVEVQSERAATMDSAMIRHGDRRWLDRFSEESGLTLIETMIACGILMVGMAGLMGLTSMAMSITENQGHLGARTTEYAVDKMEQLLELTYGDAQSNTTFFPTPNARRTTL